MVIELDSQFKKQRDFIEGIIHQIVDKHHLDVSHTTIHNLSIHLSLCISREINGNYIPTSESQMGHLKNHEYYSIAKELIERLENEYQIHIDENQICYTTMYLANMNLLDMDFDYDMDLFDDEMADVIHETISSIEEKMNINFINKESFYSGLTLHFYPALERLQSDNQIQTNPLKEQIMTKHETEFECASIFNDIVYKHYHKTFNDHELAYIALHFGTAIAR